MFNTHFQPIFRASMLTQRAVCAAPAPRRASPTPRSCEVRKPKAAARAAGRRRSLRVQPVFSKEKDLEMARFQWFRKEQLPYLTVGEEHPFHSCDSTPCGRSDSKISGCTCVYIYTYVDVYIYI